MGRGRRHVDRERGRWPCRSDPSRAQYPAARRDYLLQRADLDEDEVVDTAELERLIANTTHADRVPSHPLLVVLDENTEWPNLLKTLRHACATIDTSDSPSVTSSEQSILSRVRRGDRSVRPSDLRNLLDAPPQIICRITFIKGDSRVALLALDEAAKPTPRFICAQAGIIVLSLGSTFLELSAADDSPANEQAVLQTQIAVGAVADGYPLLRMLDTDNNFRLTARERLSLRNRLDGLDRNQDGHIDSAERPQAIRVAVTRGPRVHEYFRQPSAAVHNSNLPITPDAPLWFLGMDRNKDGDVSRREFQGSTEIFLQLDKDGDGLISNQESH